MTAVHVASGSSATSTVTLPSGVSEGDLIVVDVFLEDSQASAGTTDITPPAADDWNLVGNTDGANATSDLASFWRFVKAGDTPGTTTFTFTPAGNYAAVISVYTDTDGTTPIGDVQATSGASGTSITLAGITTTQANQLVRTTVATRGGATGFTATSPGGQNERGDDGSGRRIASYDFTVASAGASGSAQYSMSDATNTIQGIMYAIVGAGGAATQDLTGTLHDVAPTFFSGTVAAGSVNLAGALLDVAPTFFTGTVAVGAVDLAGTLHDVAPTFFSGAISTGALDLTGTLFQAAPTFNAGAVTVGAVDLAGTLHDVAPTFFTGAVTQGAANLSGSLFQLAPSFFLGAIGGGDKPRRRNAVITASQRTPAVTVTRRSASL